MLMVSVLKSLKVSIAQQIKKNIEMKQLGHREATDVAGGRLLDNLLGYGAILTKIKMQIPNLVGSAAIGLLEDY